MRIPTPGRFERRVHRALQRQNARLGIQLPIGLLLVATTAAAAVDPALRRIQLHRRRAPTNVSVQPAATVPPPAGGWLPVSHSTEAGNFYCEHAFNTLMEHAKRRRMTPQAGDALDFRDGNPLCGFLHVAPDAFTNGGSPSDRSRAERHADLRVVFGGLMRGIVREMQRGSADASPPARILISGYGPFGSVVDNPTGDFIMRPADVEAALRIGLGPEVRLLNTPQPLDVETGGAALETRFALPSLVEAVAPLQVTVRHLLLPVDDHALSRHEIGSMRQTLERFNPDAALALGVANAFRIETIADDSGYYHDAEGNAHHRAQRKDWTWQARNEVLWTLLEEVVAEAHAP